MDRPRVLIVEDEFLVAKSIAKRLEKMGYVVVDTLASGEEAVRVALRTRPDVVLMDVRLQSDIDGVEVASRIQERVDIPIIYLTAHVDEDILQRAKITSPGGYLLKPFQERELRVTLELALYRHQAEQALRRSEARYRQLFDAITSGAAIYQPVDDGTDFVFQEFNRAAEQIEGRARAEVVGRRVTDVFPGVRDFGLLEVLQRVWRTGEAEHLPPRYYQDDRTEGWRENHVYKLPSGEVVAIYEDLTEYKQTEQALRREHAMFEQLMQASPVAITVVDNEGHITFANARAEEILGLSKDEITSRAYNAPDWHSTDYEGNPWPEEAQPFSCVMRTGKPVYDVRHAIEWPDGRRVLLSINGAPLRGATGRVDGVVFAIQDVTQRVQEEAQRRAQLEQELRDLDLLSSPPQTSVTASMFGLAPLRESLPDVFEELVARHARLMSHALERRIYKVAYPVSEELRGLALHLGALRAGPRDVVEMHSIALRRKTEGLNTIRAKAFADEGRLVALELMGYLVTYYRNFALGVGHDTAVESRQIRQEKGDDHAG